jgi:tetratricopeptide (TPR) repeat protein
MWFRDLSKLVERRLNEYWRRGDPQRTERLARRYARWRPGDPHAWALWGNVLLQQRRYEEAEAVLRQGLERHPVADPDLGWLLSRALASQKKFTEARELLKRQSEIHPESRLPYLGLLEIAVRQERWDEARDLVDEVLARTRSDDYGGRYELALRLMPVPGQRKRVESLLENAIVGMPNFALAAATLGVLLEGTDDKRARELIDRARKDWISPHAFEDFVAHVRRKGGSPPASQ